MLSIHLRAEQRNGGHTTVGVFIGKQPGSRAKAGTITVTNEEWLFLCGVELADAQHITVNHTIEVSNQLDIFGGLQQ